MLLFTFFQFLADGGCSVRAHHRRYYAATTPLQHRCYISASASPPTPPSIVPASTPVNSLYAHAPFFFPLRCPCQVGLCCACVSVCVCTGVGAHVGHAPPTTPVCVFARICMCSRVGMSHTASDLCSHVTAHILSTIFCSHLLQIFFASFFLFFSPPLLCVI